MGIQLHVQYPGAEHDNPATVSLLTRGSEIKHKAPPHADLALVVAFEPEASQIDGIIKQHHVHGFAVAMGSLEDRVLNGFGAPPVPDSKTCNKQPEKCSQSHDNSTVAMVFRKK